MRSIIELARKFLFCFKYYCIWFEMLCNRWQVSTAVYDVKVTGKVFGFRAKFRD